MLQPPLPETVPSANVAVAATASGTGTAAPPSVAYSASCQFVPSKEAGSAAGSVEGATDGEAPPAEQAASASARHGREDEDGTEGAGVCAGGRGGLMHRRLFLGKRM